MKGRKEGVCRLYSVRDRKMEIEGDTIVQCSKLDYSRGHPTSEWTVLNLGWG
jgi:hypothetical protein